MKVCAVVSEFNPFHNGHKYLLSEIRKKGFDTILCIMSGNFVQRGEVAVADKRIRAQAAIESGADLVLSLPFPWSSASAEYFANGAVGIMNALGCVDAIGFGSECADISLLNECALFLVQYSKDKVLEIQKQDPKLSFAQARGMLARRILGEKAYGVFTNPNDILALEYMKAILLSDSLITPFPIKRELASHDGTVYSDSVCSSSRIRELLKKEEFDKISEYVPWDCKLLADNFRNVDIEAWFNYLRGAILSREPEELSSIAEIGGGFEYVIYRQMLASEDFTVFFEGLKSKHLTDVKIRRSLLFAAHGVKKDILKELPQFTEVLACNDSGKELLKQCRNTAQITILSKTANIRKASDIAKNQFKLQRKSEIAFEALYKFSSAKRHKSQSTLRR